ncbi:hypothetical protein M5D96_009431 [Drosophila gunungcola]|uniref:Uncharacterized protein n=1 Tax=Drosophila gunungcola TaxID=103775 RepID=A0A9P9YJ33_9MUSC|nr:hypothetical protein M5D96_009431 [Drosophila gunungcola]
MGRQLRWQRRKYTGAPESGDLRTTDGRIDVVNALAVRLAELRRFNTTNPPVRTGLVPLGSLTNAMRTDTDSGLTRQTSAQNGSPKEGSHDASNTRCPTSNTRNTSNTSNTQHGSNTEAEQQTT